MVTDTQVKPRNRKGNARGMNAKSRANLRPGLNPKGRPPKLVCVTSWLKEYADRLISTPVDPKKLTFAQAAAVKMWREAIKGGLSEYNMIVDRIEGKVGDKLDVTSKGESINDGANIRAFITGRIASIAARGGAIGDTVQLN